MLPLPMLLLLTTNAWSSTVSLNPVDACRNTGRQCIYFGKRHHVDGKLMIPFHITMDHANADPVVLNRLMERLQSMLLNGRD